MAPTVAASQAYAFNNGNAGAALTFTAGAPSAGQWDVLFVNSDTVVSTPSGWTQAQSAVTNQGAYIFTRKAVGGEAASVTVTTSGNLNAHAIWVRVDGANTADVTGAVQTNGSAGVTSPAFTSAALAQSGEIGFAFLALHSFTSAVSSGVGWGAGYTAVTSGTQGTGVSGVLGAVGYKTPVGTAAESPSASWTGNASERYLLFVSFTAAGVGTTVVTRNVASTWDVAATVTKTVATTWNTAAVVTKSVATSWDVAGAATTVSKSVTTTWDTAAVVTKATATSWDTAAAVSKTVATSWATAAQVTKPVATSWNTAAVVTKAVATTWDVDAAGQVAKSVTTSWNVAAVTAKAVATTWGVSTVVVKPVATGWDTAARVSASVTTTWTVDGSPTAGIVVRPNTGLVVRSLAGVVIRPDSGVVVRP